MDITTQSTIHDEWQVIGQLDADTFMGAARELTHDANTLTLLDAVTESTPRALQEKLSSALYPDPNARRVIQVDKIVESLEEEPLFELAFPKPVTLKDLQAWETGVQPIPPLIARVLLHYFLEGVLNHPDEDSE